MSWKPRKISLKRSKIGLKPALYTLAMLATLALAAGARYKPH